MRPAPELSNGRPTGNSDGRVPAYRDGRLSPSAASACPASGISDHRQTVGQLRIKRRETEFRARVSLLEFTFSCKLCNVDLIGLVADSKEHIRAADRIQTIKRRDVCST